MKRKYTHTQKELKELFISNGEGLIYRINNKNGDALLTPKLATNFHKGTGRNRVYINGHHVSNAYVVHTIENGDFDQSLDIEHDDCDKLNDKPGNLRTATISQNNMNRKNIDNGVIKFRGVTMVKNSDKSRVRIKLDRTEKYLGLCDNHIEGAIMYNVAAVKFHKEFATLNIIPGHQIWNSDCLTQEMITHVN